MGLHSRTHEPVSGKNQPHLRRDRIGRVLPGDRGSPAVKMARVFFWSLDTRRPIGKLGLPNSPLRSQVAVFPDGRHALTGGPNGVVHVWDLITRRQVCAAGAAIVVPSSMSRFLQTGERPPAAVRVPHCHSLGRGQRYAEKPLCHARPGRGEKCGDLAGRQRAGRRRHPRSALVSGTRSPARSAVRPVRRLIPHSDLAVLPDGRTVLTADSDGMVRLWTSR